MKGSMFFPGTMHRAVMNIYEYQVRRERTLLIVILQQPDI